MSTQLALFENYEADFLRNVANASNLNSNLYQSLFLHSQEQLFGYRISFHDYVQLISAPGVERWKIAFGWEDITGGGSRMRLLLYGLSGSGQLLRYYSLDNRVSTAFSTTADHDSGAAIRPNEVPMQLAYQWITSFENLISSGNVPASFMTVDDNRVLRAYEFQASDLSSLLTMPVPSNNAVLTPEDIYFYFVVHAAAETKAADQANEPGTLGLLLVLRYSDSVTNDSFYSHFYDFSKPCPPTC